MPPDPPETPRRDPTDDLVQMNVRVPRSLRDSIDERRAAKDLSRDKWVRNACTWALAQHPSSQPLTNSRGRTAPPPQRRP